MTTSKPVRTEPVRSRSTAEVDRLAGEARTSRTIAFAALFVALLAVGLAGWQLVAPTASCQEAAWDVEPAADDLPIDWSRAATQYDENRKTISFAGPFSQDEFTQEQVIATIACVGHGAQEAVTRSQRAAQDLEQEVIERDDLLDQAFSAVDPSGAAFLQMRKGSLIVYLASRSADTSATTLDAFASAFDKALGGDGGAITPATPLPSDDLGEGSPDPAESEETPSQAAPELVAKLPTTLGDVTLAAESYLGSEYLAEDASSRAITAALRAAGLEPDALHIAIVYDARQLESDPTALDLTYLAVSVAGMPVDGVEALVLDHWLAATGDGIERTTVTLGGREWQKIDYGTGGVIDWLGNDGDTVILIETSDAELAERAAAALP